MSNLVIKEVTFNNVTLIGVQKDGKLYVAVKKICDDLGVDFSSQLKKLKSHSVLKKRIGVIATPSNGGVQDVTCIEHKYLTNWLMSISPNKCKKDIQALLEDFQEKASDILYDAFFGKKQQQTETTALPTNFKEALKLLIIKEEEKERLERKLLEEKKLNDDLMPFAVFGQSSLNGIKKVPLSVFGKYLSQKVGKLGCNKISDFLIDKKLLFRNRKGIVDVYSQYLNADSNYQYFNLNPINYKKPVYSISKVNGVINKTKIGEEVVTGFQILILKSGMEKTVELAYKSGLFTNSEYIKVINDLPQWVNNIDYDEVKEFHQELGEIA